MEEDDERFNTDDQTLKNIDNIPSELSPRRDILHSENHLPLENDITGSEGNGFAQMSGGTTPRTDDEESPRGNRPPTNNIDDMLHHEESSLGMLGRHQGSPSSLPPYPSTLRRADDRDSSDEIIRRIRRNSDDSANSRRSCTLVGAEVNVLKGPLVFILDC